MESKTTNKGLKFINNYRQVIILLAANKQKYKKKKIKACIHGDFFSNQ